MSHEFKPFDRVLVRDHDTQEWEISIFKYYKEDAGFPYNTFFGSFKQCVPYEGNERFYQTPVAPFKKNSLKPSEKSIFKPNELVVVRDNECDEWSLAILVEVKYGSQFPYIVRIDTSPEFEAYKFCEPAAKHFTVSIREED